MPIIQLRAKCDIGHLGVGLPGAKDIYGGEVIYGGRSHLWGRSDLHPVLLTPS